MRNKGEQRAGRLSLIFLWVFLLLLCLLGMPRWAMAEEGQKIVRVGYVNASSYEEGGEGEYKRGAGYEYLQKISYVTGWKYEYVYGSFKECLDMLAAGKIDLFGNVSYTPERAAQFHFSTYPQGKDTYWLYTTKERTDLSDGNIQKLNGTRIGVTAGSYQEKLLAEWLPKNHIQADVITCNGYEELMGMINQGQLDVIAAPDLSNSYNYMALVNIGFSDYYFAVAPSRTDLLDELNGALFEIQTSETDYNSRLASRYYYKMASGLVLNQSEKMWLAAHQNTIRVGYLLDTLPFSGAKDGKMIGILATVTDEMEKRMGIHVTPVAFSDINQMKLALKDGTIDIGGPTVSDFYLAELDDFVLTHDVLQTTPVLAYDPKTYNEKKPVLAVTWASIFTPNTVSIIYPEAEMYVCADQNACLQAVVDGRATGTIIPSSRVNIINANPLMKKLALAEISHRTEVGLITTKENRRVATIMNKAISISADLLNGMVMTQHSAPSNELSIREFINRHAAILIAVATIVIVGLSGLIYKLAVSRKQIAQALAETKRANDANTAKTVFLSSMSHDIRTPMNAIVGMATLMEHDIRNPEKLDGYIHKLKVSSHYLLSLINDILDMSKIETSEVELNSSPVSMADQVAQIDSIIRPQAEDRRQHFRIRIHGISHEYLIGDGVRLRQVMVNLLSNAVKYTPNGGTISLDLEELRQPDENHAKFRITVTDTGYGMTREFMQHIFEPFTRAENSMTNKIQGTGLGMAITKNIVELMGGTISVESTVKKGSRFTVEVTLAINSLRREEFPVHRMLLLTDDDVLIHNVKMALQEEGTTLYIANNEEEAQRILKETPSLADEPIEIILFHGKNQGQECQEQMHRIKEWAGHAMLLYCCDRSQADQVRGLVTKGYIDGLLVRPFFRSNLLSAIHEIHVDRIHAKEKVSILRGMRFLCAEDNALNAEILEAILEMNGASCTICSNGVEIVKAFSEIKAGDYDAILMDMQMPVMNGLDTTRAIRKSSNPLGRTIPIIAMTANAFSEDVQQCLAAGMDAHVAKPLELSVLEKTLRNLKKRTE